MIVLQIEHSVPSFDGWKKAFDSDPIGRRQAGVRCYRILRPMDDPNYAIIELEFDSVDEAEGLLSNLKKLWASVEGRVMTNPQYRIVELVESIEI